MAIPHVESSIICTHCDKAILAPNIDLHFVHCSRNLERCKVCGDMVSKRHAQEHYMYTHAPQVACALCGETVDRENLALHENENCSQRLVSCEYCHAILPAVNLFEHQEVCGNWPIFCPLCGSFYRVRDRIAHETSCDAISNGSSSDVGETETHRRQQPQDLSQKPLLFTIAVAGAAVLLNVLATYILLQVIIK